MKKMLFIAIMIIGMKSFAWYNTFPATAPASYNGACLAAGITNLIAGGIAFTTSLATNIIWPFNNPVMAPTTIVQEQPIIQQQPQQVIQYQQAVPQQQAQQVVQYQQTAPQQQYQQVQQVASQQQQVVNTAPTNTATNQKYVYLNGVAIPTINAY